MELTEKPVPLLSLTSAEEVAVALPFWDVWVTGPLLTAARPPPVAMLLLCAVPSPWVTFVLTDALLVTTAPVSPCAGVVGVSVTAALLAEAEVVVVVEGWFSRTGGTCFAVCSLSSISGVVSGRLFVTSSISWLSVSSESLS